MPSDIDDFVAQNRRDIRNTFGRFTSIDSDRARGLTFGVQRFEYTVEETAVQRRSTGDQIIFDTDAPDEHGFDRGTFGDDRGEWVDTNADVSGSLTDAGRRWIVDRVIERDAVTAAVRVRNEPTGYSKPLKTLTSPDADTRRFCLAFNSVEYVPGETNTYAVVSEDDVDILTFETAADIPTDDDVRILLDVEAVGSALGNSIITTAGESEFLSPFNSPAESIDVARLGFGDDDQIDKSTTSLQTEYFDISADNTRVSGGFEVSADASIPENASTPETFRYISIKNDAGDTIWVTPTRPVRYEDDTEFEFAAIFQTE